MLAIDSIALTSTPLAACRDELKSDEPLRRLNSISRLQTIALALGEERTRTELIPFLSENIDDEDEVLLAEAEQLGSFVPHVGGPSHAYILLPLLENLSTVEETVVRDKAVESLSKVGAQLPDAAINDGFAPLTKVRPIVMLGMDVMHVQQGTLCAQHGLESSDKEDA
jgi:serine/threonine-protein phosphatase 2A regulatory subunit A